MNTFLIPGEYSVDKRQPQSEGVTIDSTPVSRLGLRRARGHADNSGLHYGCTKLECRQRWKFVDS